MLLVHIVMIVALLQIAIENPYCPEKRQDKQWHSNRDVLNEVPGRVLHPLTFKHNPSTESGHYNILGADGNFRHCKPVLAAGLADCPDYSDLHRLERQVCLWYECRKNELGDYVLPDKQHLRQYHDLYRMLSDGNTKAVDAEL